MKAVEWKDTRFEWCIERTFSLFVRNRCVFFHARGDKYLKTLNLAKRLCTPNVICVVYIYGDVPREETLRAKVKEAQHQLVVILVPVERFVFADIDASDELKAQFKKAGFTREIVESDIADCEKAIAAGDIDTTYSYYNTLLDEIETINRGEEAYAIIAEAQRGICRSITNFAGDDAHFGTDHDAELLALIKARFPYGVENNAPSETGAKILGKKRLVTAAAAGIENDFSEQCCGRLYPEQMSLFDAENAGAVTFVEDVRREIQRLIEAQGCFSIAELIMKFRFPPYGMYDCNYYFYLFALALNCITTEKYAVYDGVASWRFGWKVAPELWLGAQYGIVKFEDAKTKDMTRALFEIFDEQYYDEATFEDGILAMFTWCTGVGDVQEPLAMVSEKWQEFINGSSSHYSASGSKTEPPKLIDRDYRLSYYDWLCNVEKRRAEVRQTREAVYALYPEQREKIDLYYRFYTVKGGAAFMWQRNWMIERLEEYMKSIVCRECGREIESKMKTGIVYEYDEVIPGLDGKSKRESYKFTKNDVIGLNKKFLGRQRDEYYCVPCLCEIFDTTVPELWDKMQGFKIQGCTLFG